MLVATGGLSHQVHGERCGFNNPEWDLKFLDLIEKDPERLAEMTHAEYAALGGFEGAEVIMWLVMRGALSPTIRKLHQSYYLPSMTGIATAIYENDGAAAARRIPRISAHVNHQLAGHRAARGHLSVHAGAQRQGLSAEQVPARLIEPAWRAAFRANQEALFDEAGLTAEERDAGAHASTGAA